LHVDRLLEPEQRHIALLVQTIWHQHRPNGAGGDVQRQLELYALGVAARRL
jgi:hypothetical protein